MTSSTAEPRGHRLLGEVVAPLAFFALSTAVLTWPLCRDAAVAIHDEYDPYLSAYILAWDLHVLPRHPLRLFDGPQYFPHRRTLAYAEHMTGAAIQAAPLALLSGNPVLWQNALLLLSFVLAGWGAFLLARDLGLRRAEALLAGVVYAFMPYHVSHFAHVQVALYHPVPFYVLCLRRALLSDGAWRPLLGAVVCFLLVSLSCGNYFVFLYPTLIVAPALRVWSLRREPARARRVLLRFAVAGGLAATAMAPFLLPYWQVRDDLGFLRDLKEVGNFSARLIDFLRAGHDGWLRVGDIEHALSQEHHVFLGLLPSLLLLAGTLTGQPVAAPEARRARPRPERPPGRLRRAAVALFRHVDLRGERRWLIPATFLCATLLFGPRIRAGTHFIPLPYYLLYAAAPGFDGVRVPARFMILYGLGAALLAAFGAAKVRAALERRLGTGRVRILARLAPSLLVVAVLVNLDAAPYAFERAPRLDELPPVYAYLAGLPEGTPVVELPWARNFDDYSEAKYLHRVARHFQPTVNGYAGYTPPFHLMIRRRYRDSGFGSILDDLRVVGVRRVVVHTAEIEPERLAEIRALGSRRAGIRLDVTLGESEVYALEPLDAVGPEAARLDIGVPAPAARAGEPLRTLLLLHNTGDRPLHALSKRYLVRHTVQGEGERTSVVRLVPLLVRRHETTSADVMLDMPRHRRGPTAIAFSVEDESGRVLHRSTAQVNVAEPSSKHQAP